MINIYKFTEVSFWAAEIAPSPLQNKAAADVIIFNQIRTLNFVTCLKARLVSEISSVSVKSELFVIDSSGVVIDDVLCSHYRGEDCHYHRVGYQTAGTPPRTRKSYCAQR